MRLEDNKMTKIRRLSKEAAKVDHLVDMCVRHWKQGHNLEDALRFMETEAKTLCTKLASTRF